jgi:DUF971 family protein
MTADPANSHQPKRTETDVTPIDIQRQGDSTIVIRWSDDTKTTWTAGELRKACPCATCREKQRGEEATQSSSKGPMLLPVLSAAEARPLRIESMRPVGSYAYNIGFSDGHTSGIFPFVLLHEKE